MLACVSAGACVHVKCVQLFSYRKWKIEKIKEISARGRCKKKKKEREKMRERERAGKAHLGDQSVLQLYNCLFTRLVPHSGEIKPDQCNGIGWDSTTKSSVN